MPRLEHLVVTQGDDEGDRPIFNWDMAHAQQARRVQDSCGRIWGVPPLPVAPPVRIERCLPPVEGRPPPGSQPSEVGDGLQFMSALLAPANPSARLCQASAPTKPTRSSRLRENRSPVSLGKAQYSNPWPCQAHVQRLP
jgi:hypothetical protein